MLNKELLLDLISCLSTNDINKNDLLLCLMDKKLNSALTDYTEKVQMAADYLTRLEDKTLIAKTINLKLETTTTKGGISF